MCKAWYANGRRPAKKPIRLGSFEHWAETVGGILEFAGTNQFMGNADKLYSSADSEHDEWQAFLLAAWREFRKFGTLHTAAFTAAELVRRISPDCIPSAIAGYVDSGVKGLVSIGIVLKHRRERRFGEHSLRLCEVRALQRSGSSRPIQIRTMQAPVGLV
jgi:hypothetical protein